MRTWWRRIGPWLTPVLVVIEIVLVWSGLLSLLNAVTIAVVVEVLLAVTVIGRGISAVRRYRSVRAGGRDGWLAAQDGLAQLMPRRAARVLLIEAKVWICLLLWATRRGAGAPDAYPYSRGLQPLLLIVLVLVLVEGMVVETALALILGHSVWVWIALGLHLYGLIWIGGVLASLRTLPHLVGTEALQLRDSVFNRHGLLAYGDATVQLVLRPQVAIHLNGEPCPVALATLAISADDSEGLVRVVNNRASQLTSSTG